MTRWLMTAILVTLAMVALAVPIQAGSAACDTRVNNTFAKLLECVMVEGVQTHLAAFQAIADANNGTRVSGTPGYDQSAAYVADLMRAAGYQVTLQPFEFLAFIKFPGSSFAQVAPNAVTYVENVDWEVMTQTVPGDVTAAVTAVDIQLGLGNTTTSGCEAADFAGFPAGNIALIQRGACEFRVKAENAAAAGAVGVIIFNQGNLNDPERLGLIFGTLTPDYTGGIPVVAVTYARGVELASTAGLRIHMDVNGFRGLATSYNVLADSKGGDAGNVLVIGAHLDSVNAGPGIDDNGSGSAAILEVALQMKKVKPRNKVRFAWWGAEEAGLIGSNFYVASLSEAQRRKIALYLNFDMVGSPNFGRFVYDGDGSAFGLPGPAGSAAIEQLFLGFYGARGLPSEPSRINFRSDYAAFFEAGVPIGGLFTGADGVKTPAQAALYGGTAGVFFDPCYHQACDTVDNVNVEVLDLNADAIAYATLQYAMNTSTVNGVKGKGNFGPTAGTAAAAAAAERRGPRFVK